MILCALCKTALSCDDLFHRDVGDDFLQDKCQSCAKTLNGTTQTLPCIRCERDMERVCFSSAQWNLPLHRPRQCRRCFQEQQIMHEKQLLWPLSIITKKACSTCGQEKTLEDYSEFQWIVKDDLSDRQCLECLDREGEERMLEEERVHEVEERWKKDRLAVLELWRNGIELYDCDVAVRYPDAFCDVLPPSRNLVGTYDLFYASSNTYGTDNRSHLGDALQKRTVRGTIDLFLANDTDEDDEGGDDNNDNQVSETAATGLWGRLKLDPELPYYYNFVKEFTFRLGEAADGFFSGFVDEESDPVDLTLIGKRLSLDWIPNDAVDGDSTYAKQMRKKVQDRIATGPERSWLCRHKSVPESVVRYIYEFLATYKPAPALTLQEGDLWLSVELEDYSANFDGKFAARRRHQEEFGHNSE